MTEEYLDRLATSDNGEGYRRLRALFLFWGGSGPLTQAAEATAFSRPYLYELTHRAADALTPKPPGPRPGWRDTQRQQRALDAAHQQIRDLQDQCAGLRDQLREAQTLKTRTRDRLELVLTEHLVAPRAIAEILDLAFPGQAPSAEAVRKRVKQRGQLAGALMDQALNQVVADIRVLAGDEVHPNNQAVKVLMEPRSNAVLVVEHWPGKKKEDWQVCLEPFVHLAVFVSDLEGTLVGVGNDLVPFHCADWWHESTYLNTELLWRIARDEARLRTKARKALDDATDPAGPELTEATCAELVATEAALEALADEYFVALEVIASIHALYVPIHPVTGRLWTLAEAKAVADAAARRLEGLAHPQAAEVARHLRRHAHRFVGWRGQFLSLPLGLREESEWTEERVVNALLRIWELESSVYGGAVEWKDAWRLARSLRERVGWAVVDVEAAEVEVRRALKYVARSSSGVESFNNRVQVMQAVHRRLSDERLWLLGFRWNLQGRRAGGKRGGRSPYTMLGVDIGQGDKPWYDVLLDAEARRGAWLRAAQAAVDPLAAPAQPPDAEVLDVPRHHILPLPTEAYAQRAAA